MNNIWDLKAHAGKIAFVDENGENLSYERLKVEAQALAGAIGNRSLVFSLCRNELGSVLGYVSFVNNGIVPAMVNSYLDNKLLQEFSCENMNK